jgi:hypothetical protein
MSVLPPESERPPAVRGTPRPRVQTAARPEAFGTSRARFNPPETLAVGRPGGQQTRGQYVASLLRRTRRAPAKEMIEMDDGTKDSPTTWANFHEGLADKQRIQLAAAARDRQPTAAAERSGEELPIGPNLSAALDATDSIAFAEAAQSKPTDRRIIGPLAFALGRTEVRPGPQRTERAGLLDWANPPAEEELATPAETRLRGPVPDTSHMSTAFGGSTGRGIFVLTQGQLHVTDTSRYAEMFHDDRFRGVTEAYHSSITGGRPVDAAGEIEIRDGRVVAISSASGHYRPGPEHLLNTLSWLAGRGIEVSGVKVGVLDKEYDAVRFVEAGGDVAALEADALAARGVVLGRDPATGRTTASISHPTKGLLSNLSVAAQQRILSEPAGELSAGTLTDVFFVEDETRRVNTAAQSSRGAGVAPSTPATAGRAKPSAEFGQRRATLANLLPGRRRGTVAPIRDRFSVRT